MSEAVATGAVTGDLRWNIKDSFRDYVAELPDGVETWTGEVGGISEEGLIFPAVGVEVDPKTGEATLLKFGGSVQYVGYRGMLRVDIADPWIEVSDAGAVLTADTAPSGVAARRTVIAKVLGRPTRVGEGGFEWRTDGTALSAGGASLLGSVYKPGTPAAGFRLRTAFS